jgi:hypothetical protein
MAQDLSKTYIYHITDVANLPGIFAQGGLRSDTAMTKLGGPLVTIGYRNIKERRMTQYRVPCAGNRFVGEFVPFYYCPRSPMLYVMNLGNTGRPAGSQRSVVHLVSTVQAALALGSPWALSDNNAGCGYAQFFNDPSKIDELDWDAIETHNWSRRQTAKQAEFLVADFYPWAAIVGIGCQNDVVKGQVEKIVSQVAHQPRVKTKPDWYY